MGVGRFDEIPQHIVVLDLQALDAAERGILRLQGSDHAAPFVAKAARFIQIGVMAGGDKATIPCQKRQVCRQGRLQR